MRTTFWLWWRHTLWFDYSNIQYILILRCHNLFMFLIHLFIITWMLFLQKWIKNTFPQAIIWSTNPKCSSLPHTVYASLQFDGNLYSSEKKYLTPYAVIHRYFPPAKFLKNAEISVNNKSMTACWLR